MKNEFQQSLASAFGMDPTIVNVFKSFGLWREGLRRPNQICTRLRKHVPQFKFINHMISLKISLYLFAAIQRIVESQK